MNETDITLPKLPAMDDGDLALRELAAIYGDAEIGLALVTSDLVHLRVNERLAAMSGYHAEDLLGRSLHDLIPDAAGPVAKAYAKMVQSRARVGPFETRGSSPATPDHIGIYDIYLSPVLDDRGDVVAASVSVIEVTETRDLQTELADSQTRLQAALSSVPLGIIEYDPQAEKAIWDARASSFLGLPEKVHHLSLSDLLDLVPPKDHGRIREAMKRAEDPNGNGQFTVEHRVITDDGTERWISVNGAYEFEGAAAEAKPHAAIGIAADITQRKAVEEHKELLLKELQHRVRNTLAIIQAVSSQTLRASASLADFETAFSGRLAAISAAQDIVTEKFTSGITVLDMIEAQTSHLSSEAAGTLALDGADLALGGSVAHTLGLILHELCTNAAKYGALSRDGGQVHIAWEPLAGADAGLFRLDWEETGGPKVAPPDRSGFGTRLIKSSVEQFDRGRLSIDYAASGLRASITLPIEGET